MLNNPFQMPLLNAKAQKFMAETDIPGFNTPIELLDSKTKSRDTSALCGSKHAVWIGIEPPAKPNKIIPFENNIVVAFWANDTSGGMSLDAIKGGIGKLIDDPVEYEKTVAEGLDVVWSRDNETFGDYAEAVGYTAVYVVTAPVRAVYGLGAAIGRGLFGAESFKANGLGGASDGSGLGYHNEAAMAHKVSITITNEYEGVLRTVHETELAATTELYGPNDAPKPALAYFTIDSPGVWRVRVKSKASGECADPRLDINERFNVPTPTGWGQTDSPAGSQITPAAPVEITTQTSTTQVAQKTGVNPLALVGATIGVGGVLLYALLR